MEPPNVARETPWTNVRAKHNSRGIVRFLDCVMAARVPLEHLVLVRVQVEERTTSDERSNMPRHFARMFQEDPRVARARAKKKTRDGDKTVPENYVPVPAHARVILETKDERMIRSLLKTLSWNALDLFVTIAIAFAFTRSLRVSLAIGVVQQTWESVLYFGHERLWARVKKI